MRVRSAPVREQQAEVAASDLAVAVEVRAGGRIATPRAQEQAEIGAAHLAVEVDVGRVGQSLEQREGAKRGLLPDARTGHATRQVVGARVNAAEDARDARVVSRVVVRGVLEMNVLGRAA